MLAAAWAAWAVLALACGVVVAQPQPDPAEPPSHVLDTAEGPRTYRLTVPRSTTEQGAPSPLVVVLHGNGGTGARIAEGSAFGVEALRQGFVVAYPDALGGTWNYVRGIPGYPETPDDTAYLRSLVAHVHAQQGTDPARTFVVGYSNGGFMAQRLLCEAPAVFAGAVAVSAAGFAGLDELCPAGPARSIALMHGTADTNVPWDGLPVEVPGGTVLITWPVPTTFAWWAERNGCRPPAVRSERPRDARLRASSITLLELGDCAGGHRVALIALVGGGHAWPRGVSFDGAREAWRFLASVALE